MPSFSAASRASLWARTLKPMTDRLGGFGQGDVGFGDAADAGVDHAGRDLVGAELVQRGADGFDRALHVALDHQREFLAARGLELAHHVGERGARRTAARGGLVALLALAIFGDLAGAGFGLDHRDAVAGLRRAAEAEHFRREGRAGVDAIGALVVDQGAHAAPLRTGDDDVADRQRAALDQHGRDRAAAAVEPRLDDRAFRRAVGIGLEVEHFGLQRDGFEQLVEIDLLLGRNLDFERVAAEALDLHFILQQFGAHALGLGVGLVDLVDGDDDRHARRLGVADGLDRLRHDAVVGRHHQHDDVGDLGAARAHGGEGGVAGGVDEGDLAAERRHRPDRRRYAG